MAHPDLRRWQRESRAVPTTPPSKSSFAITRALGVVVVTVRGILDAAGSVRLDSTLRDLIDNQGNLAVMVDVRELTTLDPSCLDVFRRAATSATARGGELLLNDPSEAVYRAIEEAGMVAAVTVTCAPDAVPGRQRSDRVRPGVTHERAKSEHPAGGPSLNPPPGRRQPRA